MNHATQTSKGDFRSLKSNLAAFGFRMRMTARITDRFCYLRRRPSSVVWAGQSRVPCARAGIVVCWWKHFKCTHKRYSHAKRYSHPRSPNAERSTPGGAYHPAEPLAGAKLHRHVLARLSNLAGLESTERHRRRLCVSKTSLLAPPIEAKLNQ